MSSSAQSVRCLELQRPLAYLDLETTGIEITADRIVEIAILKVCPDGSEQTYHTRLNPGIPIPEEATTVHGISDADVRDEPSFASIAEFLAAWLSGCDLAGFNVARFDFPLLQNEFKRAGRNWPDYPCALVDVQTV